MLRGERCGKRVFRVGEDGDQAVAHRLDDVATRRSDRPAQQAVVPLERCPHFDRSLLPQRRAPFDVGEKEGHRACRQDRVHATTVSEQYLLDLEREAFMRRRTRARSC